MVILQNISYLHPDKRPLFDQLQLIVNTNDKIGLVGNNGTGKSTLLKIIAGELLASHGHRSVESSPYYVPQIFGQYDQLSVADALRVNEKINALQSIMRGEATAENFSILNDDWTIEERCRTALDGWQLQHVALSQQLATLSGGEKTKVFLAGISLHEPQLILLDEPSNHLDKAARKLLQSFVHHTKSTLIMVSHDRRLLNYCTSIFELSAHGIEVYGGNYDFYAEQKEIAQNALHADIHSKEKALRKAREQKKDTLERQQRSDSRGKAKQEKAGVARIMMNTLRNQAENSTAKAKASHNDKIEGIARELKELQSALPDTSKIKFGFDNSALHKGKVLFQAENINVAYNAQPLWKLPLNFTITSGERIIIKGRNGSGKTTLIKLLTGELAPSVGVVHRALMNAVYIDQDYSLLNNALTVKEQAAAFNTSSLQTHEINARLTRFLFNREDWDKPFAALSGGERMRLIICCLTLAHTAPDLIILDEPTNNLDLQSVEMLTAAINEYEGTLIVVSHDETWVEEIDVKREIELD